MLLQHSKFTNHVQKNNIYKSHYQAKEIYKPEKYTATGLSKSSKQLFYSTVYIKAKFSCHFHHQIVHIVNVCSKIKFTNKNLQCTLKWHKKIGLLEN